MGREIRERDDRLEEAEFPSKQLCVLATEVQPALIIILIRRLTFPSFRRGSYVGPKASVYSDLNPRAMASANCTSLYMRWTVRSRRSIPATTSKRRYTQRREYCAPLGYSGYIHSSIILLICLARKDSKDSARKSSKHFWCAALQNGRS